VPEARADRTARWRKSQTPRVRLRHWLNTVGATGRVAPMLMLAPLSRHGPSRPNPDRYEHFSTASNNGRGQQIAAVAAAQVSVSDLAAQLLNHLEKRSAFC